MELKKVIENLETIRSVPDFYAYKVYILKYMKDEEFKQKLATQDSLLEFFKMKDEILEKLKE